MNKSEGAPAPARFRVVVDRKTWYRGRDPLGSYLLGRDSMRCCLGFAGQSAGIPDEVMEGRKTPVCSLRHESITFKKLWESLGMVEGGVLTAANSALCRLMMGANDSPLLSDPERERNLITLGKQGNIDFEFIN